MEIRGKKKRDVDLDMVHLVCIVSFFRYRCIEIEGQSSVVAKSGVSTKKKCVKINEPKTNVNGYGINDVSGYLMI